MENLSRFSSSASSLLRAFWSSTERQRRAHVAAIANRLTERHIHRGEN